DLCTDNKPVLSAECINPASGFGSKHRLLDATLFSSGFVPAEFRLFVAIQSGIIRIVIAVEVSAGVF
ncbi:hypothetical protein, partial [Pontibacterium sp.]|uniref:hypothetical protein n=1 Tax=Pontibacterium sp. TaxID=2036026 RepID=UPI0035122B4C